MSKPDAIPVFTLFGETGAFPDVVHCETLFARAPSHDWRIAAHRHAHIAQLFLISDGHAKATVDGQQLELAADCFLYVPIQAVHAFQFEPNSEGMVVSLPSHVLNSVGPAPQDILSALNAPVLAECTRTMTETVDLLFRTFRSSTRFRAQRAVGLAHSVLAEVADAAELATGTTQSAVHPRMFELDTLIADNMHKGWGASDYAEALSLSTGHLSRLCRNASGMGAAAYIEASIMNEACRLLAFTAIPISAVGYRLGFDDPSYFSKRFRAARRRTPSDYRATFTH